MGVNALGMGPGGIGGGVGLLLAGWLPGVAGCPAPETTFNVSSLSKTSSMVLGEGSDFLFSGSVGGFLDALGLRFVCRASPSACIEGCAASEPVCCTVCVFKVACCSSLACPRHCLVVAALGEVLARVFVIASCSCFSLAIDTAFKAR